MILTITLNPSLDRVVWVDKLSRDDSVRIRKEKHYAGGKGIDASRVIKSLGGSTVAMGFLGSFNGLHLEGLLINEGVNCNFIKIAGETRSNIIIFSEEEQGHIALNSSGPEITPYDIALLFQKIDNLSVLPSYVVIGGSVPQGIQPDIYAQLIHKFRSQGVKVALDADNEALRLGIEESPFLIKPNEHEFARLIGREIETDEEYIQLARDLIINKGIEIIILSRGAKGLFVITKDEAYSIVPPKIKVNSTIGSGDSTLAAFLLGLENNKTILESGIMGVAAGAGTAMSPGVELVDRFDYDNLIGQVMHQKL